MNAIVIVGLGYGDEGKGTIVDALTRQRGAELVVRFNGGFQAAHNVHTEDGLKHTFSQFGSGTLAGAKTILAERMIINPLCHQVEATALEMCGITNPLSLCYVHNNCAITTPFHKALNNIRELSRRIRHGSVGVGVGETVRMVNKYKLIPYMLGAPSYTEDVLDNIKNEAHSQCLGLIHDYCLTGTDVDLAMKPFMMKDAIKTLVTRYTDWASKVNIISEAEMLTMFDSATKPVIFEGAQGVLLDQEVGFHPYTTWSQTTDLGVYPYISDSDKVETVGVTRAFMTRHGAGPFVTEHPAGFYGDTIYDDDNGYQDFTGRLRSGFLDLAALQYAIKHCAGIDSIALTHCDKLAKPGTQKVCIGYDGADLLNYEPIEASPEAYEFTELLKKTKPVYDSYTDLPKLLEQVLNIPVIIQSHGKTYKEKNMGMPPEDDFQSNPKIIDVEIVTTTTTTTPETAPVAETPAQPNPIPAN